MITSEQIRAARALLRWDQMELAERSGVSVETVKRLEKIKGPMLSITGATLAKLQHAFNEVGVEFVNDERGEGLFKRHGQP